MSVQFFTKIDSGHIIGAPIEPFKFPGGEVHLKIDEDTMQHGIQIAVLEGASHDDLFTVAMWNDFLHDSFKFESDQAVAVVPYLPGARADRGLPLGARVYADFLGKMDLTRIVTIDPHSDIMPQLFDPGLLKVIPVHKYIKGALATRVKDGVTLYRGILAPDKGAVARANRAGKELDLEVFQAEKKRDFATGNLTAFHVPELPEGRFLIIDDICDGGGTFAGIAKASGKSKEDLDLWVTHGIFSGRWQENLVPNFGRVFTTDSHSGAKVAQAIAPETISVRPMLSAFIREATYGLDRD